MALFNEGLVIQKNLHGQPRYSLSCDDQPHSARFACLMTQGCVNAILRCLSHSCDCGPLGFDHMLGLKSDGSPKMVLDVLREKHPCGCTGDPYTILDPVGFSQVFHPVLFDNLDAALIKSIVL